MTARKFYTRIKKDESRDTDVGTENIRPKALCDRRSDSERIVAGQTATRANKPATLYLAINWQRGHINTRFTSKDRRFPTPQPTTRHLFWPNQPGKAASLLPIWLRNSGILGRRDDRKAQRGGRGGSAGRNWQNRLIHKLTQDFITKGLPYSVLWLEKNAGPRRLRPMQTSAPTVTTVP
jgi:hypothetical protein